MKLSIVIPCYNEEKNIPLIFEACAKAISRTDIEIVLVNNGSTDGSEKIINDNIGKYGFLKVVKVSVNQGYGFGIISGLKEASGEYIGWTHGDMQTPPSDIIKALELIEKKGNPKNIYVKGLRKKRPLFDQAFTYGMSIFETIYMGETLFDINAQPNIFHRDFFASWNDAPYDFSLDLYAIYMARKQKLDIVRMDVIFPKRIHGVSHWNKDWKSKWKFIKRTVDFSLKLKKTLK